MEGKYKQYLDRLIDLQNDDDLEYAHGEADCILCEILNCLGLHSIVDEYDKIEKLYA